MRQAQLEAFEWRSALEMGNLLDSAAEMAWKLAAAPIIVPDDPDPFTSLMIDCDGRMEEMVQTLARTSNVLLWSDQFLEMLLEYHERSHLIGQAGKDLKSLAKQRAYQVVNLGAGLSGPEADYVLGFLNDLMNKDGRYYDDGDLNGDEVLRRMRMYQGKMRGTAGWGLVDPLPPQEEIHWVLGGNEDHCADCPYNAEVSPWTKETLYTTPGGGDTPCLFNCLCHLRVGEISSPMPVLRAA